MSARRPMVPVPPAPSVLDSQAFEDAGGREGSVKSSCPAVLAAAIDAAALWEHERTILHYLAEQTQGSIDDMRNSGRLWVRRGAVKRRLSRAKVRRIVNGLQAHDMIVVEPDARHSNLWIWRLAPDVLEVLPRLVLEATP